MSASLVETLEEQGFAVVRGLLPPDEVRQIASAFDALLAHARRLQSDADVDGARFVVDTDPFRLKRVVWAGGAEPVLARYGDDPRFLRIAAEVLGTDRFVQLIQQAHFKLPGDGVDFRFHQDASNRRYGSDLWTDVNGRGSFVQLALAVDPMRPENGPLRFIPDSHRLGFIADPTTGVLPGEGWDPHQAVDLLLDPGDLAVFGPFAIHGSPANTGDSARRLFLQGYACEGANRRVYPGSGTGVPRRVH